MRILRHIEKMLENLGCLLKTLNKKKKKKMKKKKENFLKHRRILKQSQKSLNFLNIIERILEKERNISYKFQCCVFESSNEP